ncbi:MAG: hypothetical protein HQ556_05525 [Candidatus Marinimicrobia bacterium]|nr:hypothetical protein [Candidatus Neomarinimicrobiota bacterium]
MKNIRDQIEPVIQELNLKGIPDFEGYSPFEMGLIIDELFGENCPVQLNPLSEADYLQIPLLNLYKYLAKFIRSEGEMKLTARGYLSPRVVKDMYGQGFIPEYPIEGGITKLTTENDSLTVQLVRILLEMGGIIKKRNNKLSLTKQGEALLQKDDHILFPHLFKSACKKFNWAYFDAFEGMHIGQYGFGFSLILLNNYGRKQRGASFYAEKYFTALPDLVENQASNEESTLTSAFCYSTRTFVRFLAYFNLVSIQDQKMFWEEPMIGTTTLFTKLIKIIPPMNPR